MQSPPRTKVYLEGRYRKLTRDLPQTIFWCPKCKGHARRRKGCSQCEGFGKLTRDSVQERVGWVLGKAFGTRNHKFHGAGREDLDVRMLGEGRPFVFELVGPKITDVDLATQEQVINDRNEGRLEIVGLHWTEKERVRVLKESKHAKRYCARIAFDGDGATLPIDEILGQRFIVEQQTPGRVAHRRADKIRERWVEVESLELLEEPNVLEAVIKAEHGTYVKEAISGEDERTRPSLTELLGVPCRCIELDVLGLMDEEGDGAVVTPAPEQPPAFGTGIDLG